MPVAKQVMALARWLNAPPNPMQRPEQLQPQNNGHQKQRAVSATH